MLCVVACGAAAGRPLFAPEAAWLGAVGVWAGGLGAATALSSQLSAASRARRPWGRLGVLVALSALAMMAAFLYAAYQDGSLRLDRLGDSFFNRDLLRLIAPDLARGAVNTLKLAFAAEVLAILVGLVVATMIMSPRRWLRWPGVAYVDVIRSIPLVVLALVISGGLPYLGLTLGTFAAVTSALTVNASAYVAETFRAGIQSLTRGQMDAARSLGMPRSTAMIFVIIPQAVRAVIPPLLNEFIALIKDTAIVIAVLGATIAQRELFGAAKNAVAATFSPTPYVGAAIGYIIMVIPLTRLLGLLERRLRADLA